MLSMSPRTLHEELRVEFTREELFQFYSQVRTNENGLGVCVCMCPCGWVVACVRACVRACVYHLHGDGEGIDRGSADGCSMEVC